MFLLRNRIKFNKAKNDDEMKQKMWKAKSPFHLVSTVLKCIHWLADIYTLCYIENQTICKMVRANIWQTADIVTMWAR